MNALTTISLTLILSACSSPRPPLIISEATVINYPAINTVAVVEIGDTLLEKSIAYTYEGLELYSVITDGGTAREYVMNPHKLPYTKTDKNGDKYFEASSTNYYVNDKLFGQKVPLYEENLILKKDGSLDMTGYFDLTSAGPVVTTNPQFEVGELVDETQPSFKQELIYNGRSGSTLKFMYREFSKDFARPSYSQDVNYDLAESNTIGFKGARIEVIEASNTVIKYKINSSFPN